MKVTTSKTPNLFALLSTGDEAVRAICRFREAGFAEDSISLLYPKAESGSNLLANVHRTQASNQAMTGAIAPLMFDGIIAGLIELGLPDYEARLYQREVEGGKTLIVIHCTSGAQERTVHDIFRQEGASQVLTLPIFFPVVDPRFMRRFTDDGYIPPTQC